MEKVETGSSDVRCTGLSSLCAYFSVLAGCIGDAIGCSAMTAAGATWFAGNREPVTLMRSSDCFAEYPTAAGGGGGAGGGAMATLRSTSRALRSRRACAAPSAASAAASAAIAAGSAAAAASASSALPRLGRVVLHAPKAKAKPRARVKWCGWGERCMVRLHGWVADGNAWLSWTGLAPGEKDRQEGSADHQQALLGHVLDRIAHAFAAEARMLHAAIGHVVDAEARHVADDDAADFQAIPGPHRMRQVAGEHAGLQAEVAVVDAVERVVEIIEGLDHRDRTEGLLAIQLAVVRDFFQQCGRQHVALARATGEDLGATLARGGDPAFHALRRLVVDHRADERFLVVGVAHGQSGDGRLQLAPQLLVDGRMRVDPLHADAALPGLVVGAEDQAFDHVIERRARIGIDDAGRIATQFERDLLAASTRPEVPADQAAREAQQGDAFVLDQGRGVVRGADDYREGPFGQVGLGEDLTEDQRADRSLVCGLEHEGAAGRDRRRDLVRHQVEREVERRDEAAHADRHPLDHAAIAARTWRDLQFQQLAMAARGFVGGDAEGVDQAGDLATRVPYWFAGFDAQCLRQLLEAFVETADAVFQHVAAGIRRERRHRFACLVRSDYRLAHGRRIREGHARGALAGVFVEDVQFLLGVHRLVGEVVGIVLGEHGTLLSREPVPRSLNHVPGTARYARVGVPDATSSSLPAAAACHRPGAHRGDRPERHRAR